MKRNLLLLFVRLTCSLLMLEMLSGYYIYNRHHNESSFVRALVSVTSSGAVGGKPRANAKLSTDTENVFLSAKYTEKSPFSEYYHPFIGFTSPNHSKYDIETDFFGFRNKEDIYFEDNNYITVVITGSSEVKGHSHETTVAEKLESLLNKNGGKKEFKVITLAADSYTLSDEINAYVNLAYHLKPQFVISHTGWNDIWFGLMVPYNFKKIGMFYQFVLLYFLPRLHELKTYSGDQPIVLNLDGMDLIVPQIIAKLEKYESIVTSNDGIFIAGLQAIEREHQFGSPKNIYSHALDLYEELTEEAGELGHINFTGMEGITFGQDHVHTDDASSLLIAQRYADVIERELKNRSGNSENEQ